MLFRSNGDQMVVRFPLLQAYWHGYLNRLPVDLRAALNGDPNHLAAVQEQAALIAEINLWMWDEAVAHELHDGMPLWFLLMELPYAIPRLLHFVQGDPGIVANALLREEFGADHEQVAETIRNVGVVRLAAHLPTLRLRWEQYMQEIPVELFPELGIQRGE